MAPKGRKRIAAQSVASVTGDVPRAQAVRLQRIFGAHGPETESGVLNRAKLDDEEFGQSWTPYGTLIKELDKEYEETGARKRVTYLCPRALLYLACLFAPAFAQMFGQTVGLQVHGEAWPSRDAFANAPVGRVVLYADEVRPGNALRPDEGRLYLGVYWSVMEFPEWFRASPKGWLPLCDLRSTALQQLEAGLSELMVSLLGVFFSAAEGGENLAREGVLVPHAHGRATGLPTLSP